MINEFTFSVNGPFCSKCQSKIADGLAPLKEAGDIKAYNVGLPEEKICQVVIKTVLDESTCRSKLSGVVSALGFSVLDPEWGVSRSSASTGSQSFFTHSEYNKLVDDKPPSLCQRLAACFK